MKAKIINTVDWEGRCLERENLEAMRVFNTEFLEIPTLHFMNAAYFTKGMDDKEVEKKIRTGLKDNDILGLHIHCWRSLVQRAGLEFRTKPSFVYKNGIPAEELEKVDCGHDLSLSAYDKIENIQLIKTSEKILNSKNLLTHKYFRAGGWVANSETLHALQESGYTHDFSALPPELMKGKRKNETLFNIIEPIWKEITPYTKPYSILPGLLEYPNSACLADYMHGKDFLEIFNQLCEKGEDFVFVMGFHQETAYKFINHVREGLKLIHESAKKRNVDLEYCL